MKTSLGFLVVAGTSLVVAFAHAVEPAALDNAKVLQELQTRQDEMISGLLKGDLTAWEAGTAEDTTTVDANGLVLDKSAIRRILKSSKIQSWNVDDLTVRAYGNCLVLTGRNTVSGHLNGNNENKSQFRVTSVLVNRDGKWQTAASQFTRIAPASTP
jgi:hypothetical protein